MATNLPQEAMDDSDQHAVPVFGDDGKPVKARFSARVVGDAWHVVLESRGGRIGTPSERNSGYSTGLRVLLGRLAELDTEVLDAFVESALLVKKGFTPEARRLHGVTFPLTLNSQADAGTVASALQIGQRTVGSADGQSGGNTTRRLLFVLKRTRPAGFDIVSFLSVHAAASSQPVPLGPVPVAGAPDAVPVSADGFDPASVSDARKRVLVALAQREGQPAFRKKLLAAYGNRCAISGCDLLEALEAAHIVPYWGPQTNHVQNGILMRADLHTLFDRGLFGVDPQTLRLVVDPRIRASEYAFLHDLPLNVPDAVESRPSSEALKRHLDGIGLGSRPDNSVK